MPKDIDVVSMPNVTVGTMPPLAVSTLTATIAAAGSLSGAVQTEDKAVGYIQMPAAWTAAGLTFQVSADGVTYQNLYKEDGTEFALTVAASTTVRLSPMLLGAGYIKIRSGTGAVPVAQAAERAIILHLWS